MDDARRPIAKASRTTKEAWREADGEESLADHVGNVGDELRKQAGNAGDAIDRGWTTRTDQPRRPGARPTARSLADKIGNAGDDLRNSAEDVTR